MNRLYPDAGKTALALLSSKDVPEIESCIISFINEIIRMDGRLYLYIDDMHLIEEKAIYGERRILLARIKFRQNLMIEAEEIVEELIELFHGENLSRIFVQGCDECSCILGELEKKGRLPESLSPFASRDVNRRKIILEINDFQEPLTT